MKRSCMILLGVALWGIMYAYDTTYGNYYFNLLEATAVEDVGGLMTYHYNIEATNREGKTGGSFNQTYSGTIAPPATFTVSEYNSGTFVYTLTRIGDMAFANNSTATEIIIPETVTEIADLGLLANWGLKKITCLAKTPPSHNSNFLLVIGDVSNSATLYVPAGCKSKYQTANGWRAFQNIVELEPTLGDHEYVDLDLPSGKLWSTQNYGAIGPREAGSYNYWSSLDVVTTNWGSCWATPTRAEIEELINYCTWTWDASYKGYTVTGPNGKSMFLPAAGFEIMGYGQQVGTHLYYMSSTTGNETGFVFMLYGSSTDYNINTTYNASLVMAPIRPIVKGMTNASLQESGGSDSDDKGSDFTNLEVGSLYFTRTSENSCKVAKAYKSIATCSIPTNVTYDGHSYTVTAIGESAFRSCTSLTSVTIPNSVMEIGEDAFAYCTSLTSVTIPNSVTEIGSSAFYDCTRLKSVTIPNSVTEIGKEAFYECTSLTSVTIPNSVTTIGNYAFARCKSLTSVTIPNSVTEIERGAFYYCSSLTSVTIPNSVTTIGELAFQDCSSLTSVTIPNSVTEIGDYAFSICSSLASVTIPNSVTTIGRSAFWVCTSLTSVTIPNSVTEIGEGAFHECSGLTSLTIPNSVTSIGQSAFSGCTGISQLTFEDGDATLAISSDAFKSTSLTEVYFGRQMDFTKVPCENLETVELGKHVTSMVKGAFTEGNAVRTVISHNPVPPTADDDDIFSTRTYLEGELYVPKASIKAYQAANGWKLFGVVKALPNDSVGDTNNTVILVATIQLDATEATLNEGATMQLNAVVSPESADNKTLQWSSSNQSVASVNQTGLITAHQKGSAIITVESTDSSQVSAMCIIIVLRPVTGIYTDVQELTLGVGESVSIVAYATPTDATNTTLTWSSSDEAVATVKDGVVSAIAEGTATITVQTTDGSNISQTCLVHVSNSSGIGSVTGDALTSISVKHGVVYVNGKAPDDEVSVYTMSGTLLTKTKDNKIPLSQSGAFIVRVKQIAQKIVL